MIYCALGVKCSIGFLHPMLILHDRYFSVNPDLKPKKWFKELIWDQTLVSLTLELLPFLLCSTASWSVGETLGWVGGIQQ